MKLSKLQKYLVGATLLLLIFAFIGKKAGWFGEGKLTEVTTEKVERRTIIETVTASGKVQPEIEVKISPDVSGEIVELNVKEGDRVKKGQLLAKIRPDIYLSELDRAMASLNTTKANMATTGSQLVQVESRFKRSEAAYKRNKQLFADKIISPSEYENSLSEFEVAKAEVEAIRQSMSAARFNVQSSEANVKQTRENLNKTTIFSPIDGIVSSLQVELGERVVGTSQMAGTEMMRVADLSSMEVNVEVNENDINRISLGDTSEVEVDAYLDRKFKGLVTEIANSATVSGGGTDQVTNFAVKIRVLPESYADFKDLKGLSPFRPGLSATVEIQTERRASILTLPIQAVTTRADTAIKKVAVDKTKPKEEKEEDAPKEDLKEYIYVFLPEGKVKQVEVKTGIQDESFIEIKSGVKGDEEVVTAPYLAISKKLKNDMKVKKVEKDKLFNKTEK